MPTIELSPIRQKLPTDDELIFEMNIVGNIVSMRWDPEKKCPYYHWYLMANPPLIKGKFFVFHPKGDIEEQATPYKIFTNDYQEYDKYYLGPTGEWNEDISADSINSSITALEQTVMIENNGYPYMWKYDFDITMELDIEGKEYNYITLTGFTIFPD